MGIWASEEDEYNGVGLSECGMEFHPEFVSSKWILTLYWIKSFFLRIDVSSQRKPPSVEVGLHVTQHHEKPRPCKALLLAIIHIIECVDQADSILYDSHVKHSIVAK